MSWFQCIKLITALCLKCSSNSFRSSWMSKYCIYKVSSCKCQKHTQAICKIKTIHMVCVEPEITRISPVIIQPNRSTVWKKTKWTKSDRRTLKQQVSTKKRWFSIYVLAYLCHMFWYSVNNRIKSWNLPFAPGTDPCELMKGAIAGRHHQVLQAVHHCPE